MENIIKLIKIGETIYEDFEPVVYYLEGAEDEEGEEGVEGGEGGEIVETRNPLLPEDLEDLRKIVIDTINWKVGQDVKNATQDVTKLSASNSKAVVLLLKVLNTLNPDLSGLTEKEKAAYDKMAGLATAGYADSDLLNASLDAVIGFTKVGQELINKALEAQTEEELLAVLNEL